MFSENNLRFYMKYKICRKGSENFVNNTKIAHIKRDKKSERCRSLNQHLSKIVIVHY